MDGSHTHHRKAGNEQSIQALAHRAIELAKIELKDMEQVNKEGPVAYDSMTNGGAEVGVRFLRGQGQYGDPR